MSGQNPLLSYCFFQRCNYPCRDSNWSWIIELLCSIQIIVLDQTVMQISMVILFHCVPKLLKLWGEGRRSSTSKLSAFLVITLEGIPRAMRTPFSMGLWWDSSWYFPICLLDAIILIIVFLYLYKEKKDFFPTLYVLFSSNNVTTKSSLIYNGAELLLL